MNGRAAPPSYLKMPILVCRQLGTEDLEATFFTPRQGTSSHREGIVMSSTDNMRTGRAKRSASSSEDLNEQIEAIRADIQSLTQTVGRIANTQINRAQDKAMETAAEAEEAIKRNPLSAVAIAVGLGFLFGVFSRR